MSAFRLIFLLLSSLFSLAAYAQTYYYNNGQSALINQLRSEGVQVYKTGDRLKVVLGSDRIFKGLSTTQIRPSQVDVLNQVAQLFLSNNEYLITVSAHTDNVGTDRDKFRRSEQQANTVAAYLWSCGYPLHKMIIIGCGDTEPVASNKTINGSAANRRVEIESDP